MDARFQPAKEAIKSGNLERLRTLLSEDTGLATTRSSCSHPTLFQCVALETNDLPNRAALAQALIKAGAEIDGPLVSDASGNNTAVAAALLDAGAAIDGHGCGRRWKKRCTSPTKNQWGCSGRAGSRFLTVGA